MSPASNLFVDTAGWADPVLGNTPDHALMEAFYKQALTSGRTLVTTNYVLAELIALLTARTHASRAQVLALIVAIKALPNLRMVHIDPSLDEASWALLEQYSDKAWSLVDAASFVVMRQLGISEAFTTDRHVAQAGFVCLPVRPD